MGVLCGIWSANTDRIKGESFDGLVQDLSFLNPKTIDRKIDNGNFKAALAQVNQLNSASMISDDRLIVVSDARIDNKSELSDRLSLSSNCSNFDIISALYLKYDEAFEEYLVGAFCIVIFDKRKNKVLCTRDQMGVKPFHYYYSDGLFLFASCKRSFTSLAKPYIALDVNMDYVHRLVAAENQNPRETCFSEVYRLLPAELLKLEEGRITKKKYWTLEPGAKIRYKNSEDYQLHFKEKFEEAVRCRVAGTSNIGAELSGGLDSSGVTAQAHDILELHNRELYTYSYVSPLAAVENKNENVLVDSVVSHLNLKNQRNISQARDISYVDSIKESVTLSGGLDTHEGIGRVEIWEACKKDNVQVLLSGFPGDELVTSFCRSYYLEYLERGEVFKYLKHSKNHVGIIKTVFPLLPGNQFFYKFYDKFFRTEMSAKSFLNKDYYKPSPYTSVNFFKSLSEQHAAYISHDHTSKRMETENSEAAGFGIDVRYPLADIRLLDYVLRIPLEERFAPGKPRLLFRRYSESLLPKEVVWYDSKNHSTRPFSHINNAYQSQLIDWAKNIVDKADDFLDKKKLIRKMTLPIVADEPQLLKQQKQVLKTLLFLYNRSSSNKQ